MKTAHDLDRSTMFTNLCTISYPFGRLPQNVGSQLVTEALAAWYETGPEQTDMYAFAKAWLLEHHVDLTLRTG